MKKIAIELTLASGPTFALPLLLSESYFWSAPSLQQPAFSGHQKSNRTYACSSRITHRPDFLLSTEKYDGTLLFRFLRESVPLTIFCTGVFSVTGEELPLLPQRPF